MMCCKTSTVWRKAKFSSHPRALTVPPAATALPAPLLMCAHLSRREGGAGVAGGDGQAPAALGVYTERFRGQISGLCDGGQGGALPPDDDPHQHGAQDAPRQPGDEVRRGWKILGHVSEGDHDPRREPDGLEMLFCSTWSGCRPSTRDITSTTRDCGMCTRTTLVEVSRTR